MAIKSTIFKANLQIADIDHNYYADHGLIASLDIPQAEKDRLLAMTPGSYVGKAAELARRV